LKVFVPSMISSNKELPRDWNTSPHKKEKDNRHIEIDILKESRNDMYYTESNGVDLDQISSRLGKYSHDVNLHSEELKEILPRLISMGYKIKKFSSSHGSGGGSQGIHTTIEIYN
jgi:hypothetical protein